MKVVIEYDRFEDREELDIALNGIIKEDFMDIVWNDVFREYYKNGIPDNLSKEDLLNDLVTRFHAL